MGLTEGVDVVAFADLGGWPGLLRRVLAGGSLTADEAACAMGQVLAGEATSAQVAAFVVALRAKEETVEEMTGFVRAFLAYAEPLVFEGDVIDTCGTGGDRSASINVSTIAALVVAGAGVPVCKHGGRAASSAAGSADVLEQLGVVVDLGPAGVARCIAEVGMGFCFAPRFHPAMRHVGPVRAELGIATVFNFLGPLANPARARLQVVGVSDPAMATKMLGVLVANGARRAMVVHGADGLDELSTSGPSDVLFFDADADAGVDPGADDRVDASGDAGAESGAGAGARPEVGSGTASSGVLDRRVRRIVVDPAEYGLTPATVADIRGGDPATNAALARRVLGGGHGPHRDVVLLNAAAGLVVGGAVTDIAAGLVKAAEVVDSGRAEAVLDQLVAVSRSAGEAS
ncbi:MAG: anthranilate phosphoribosyltransferase [Actinomycetota bacterium]|nr:anthranilate phosphoribosyltransferase [Actinomycetota bacterium]